ncbi:MAG: restriction endonuclease [Ignavibacteria bacterium]|nr:restriction endonuclease [Ignavibacteria bacterium]
MAIPDFQTMMLPILSMVKATGESPVADIREAMALKYGLTPAELTVMLPSGRVPLFNNRVGWCLSHLKQAGLITSEKRAVYTITDAGSEVLKAPPDRITVRYLTRFPSFVAFREKSEQTESIVSTNATEPEGTPDELIARAFDKLNGSLATELAGYMAKMDPYQFEQLVVDLLAAMGYGGSREEAASVTRKSGDEGIDGIINQDRLGLDVVYIQAKRWANNVGRADVQAFVGALAGKQANKGIMITTSDFSKGAFDYAAAISQKVILIDGARLAELMIEHNVGVSVARTIDIKRIDSDYFEG